MPTPYFEVAHLTKHFSTDESTVAAIQDVSFSLQKGQFLSILGPSGCGKSTLFNLIAGLMQPDYGEIRLQGESMLLLQQLQVDGEHLFRRTQVHQRQPL